MALGVDDKSHSKRFVYQIADAPRFTRGKRFGVFRFGCIRRVDSVPRFYLTSKLTIPALIRIQAAHFISVKPGVAPLKKLFEISFACVVASACVLPSVSGKPSGYQLMEQGPFMSYTIADGWNEELFTHKGIAVRLGSGSGGEGGVLFDTDLCRVSSGWTGGYLELAKDLPRIRSAHGVLIEGEQLFATPVGPVWSSNPASKVTAADFADPRKAPFGPVSFDLARYRGVYVHGEQTVISYEVAGHDILESYALEGDDNKVMSRTMELAPHAQPLTLLLCDNPESIAKITQAGEKGFSAALSGKHPLTMSAVASGSVKAVANGSMLLVEFPPATTATRVTFRFAAAATTPLSDQLADAPSALTKGGPAHWTKTVVTQGKLGSAQTGSLPYALDELPLPFENPYKSPMRIGGFDFADDGTAAYLSTWEGEVWRVDGIDQKLEKLTWRRIATGLFHGLGIRVVDGHIYVHGRDQLTRLHDLNADGEIDFYECFNNLVTTTPNFHEFAFDLQTDAEGNFYMSKGAPVRNGGRGFETIADHHGCVLKVSADGKTMERYATGLRAPNGIGIGPEGQITSSDNEGTYVPTTPLHYWRASGAVGTVVDTAHGRAIDHPRPLLWLPKTVDNSGGGQVWIPGDAFGPLSGQLLHLSYGKCRIFQVLPDADSLEDTAQGAAIQLPFNLMSGSNRARFHKASNALFVSGLSGWQSSAPRVGSFQRIRYTGGKATILTDYRVLSKGLELTFSEPLDAEDAEDVQAYALAQWNYRWTSEYGSKHYQVSNPEEEGKDKLVIASASLSDDARVLTLHVPALQPVHQLELRVDTIDAADEDVVMTLYATVHPE